MADTSGTNTGPDEEFVGSGQLWYAGFWPRFGATLIDGLVLAPVTILSCWLLTYSKPASIALVVPLGVIGPAYEVVLLARYGQTVGKMATGIAVFRTSGEPIGWLEVTLRCSVQISFGILSIISLLYAMTRLPEANWTGGWITIEMHLHRLRPSWSRWSVYAINVWTYSELITLLFNRKRRAIHDFIAGTVVLRVRD